MKKKLFTLLLLGLTLRLVLSVMGHYGDIDNYFIVWAQSINDHGLSGFYGRIFNGVTSNYPPFSIISFSFLYKLYYWLDAFIWKINTSISFFPSQLVVLWRNPDILIPALIKLPSIIADLALAWIFFRYTKKLTAAALVLFNPAFFYNSSLWGQIDIIPIFFVMWAFYLVKKYPLSIFLFTIALLFKQTVIVFLPLYLLLIWKKNGLKNLAKSLIIPLILIFIAFLPFYKTGNIFLFPFTTFSKILVTGGSVFLTAHAFNFWGLITGFGHIPDGPYRFLSLIFVAILSMVILWKMYKRRFKKQDIFAVGFLIPWIFFLFATRMHERHLMLTLPFMLLAAIDNPPIMKTFIFLSFFSFLNLYTGWGMPPDNVIRILIVITIILFTYLYYHYIKGDYAA